MPEVLHALLVGPAAVFLASIGLLTFYRLFSGKIRTHGLLTEPRTGRVSALRIQMLFATLGGLGSYIAAFGHHADKHSFPAVSDELLMLLGGSQGLLAGGRGVGLLVSLLRRP